jgi:dynamin 1-like protein
MSSLQDLIPVVNKLQDIVTSTQLADLDLPILAVVGSQLCGKLSVLENIVGKDFLPRGTGIVTRRPLVLQLIHVNPDDIPEPPLLLLLLLPSPRKGKKRQSETDDVNLEEHLRRHANGGRTEKQTSWGEFLHLPNKRFYNFDDIRSEISNETLRIAGQNKGISRLPINLKIYSDKVLDLTLVDLPGLTKIPIGDQPTDIERQTRNLILEYISKPNCIILAVSPANVDLVNSESLKLARQVDPSGKRTVGILSKLDLMDQGTNALDILKGNIYPLKLGFIGIVNRSQQDIADNKSMDDSLFAEQQFFLNHPAYRQISNKCGTKFLSQTLNKILMNHIRERLPDIKAKLNTLMGQTEQELASYGEIPLGLESDTKESRGALVLSLMTKFANSFVNLIEGTSMNDISTKELCGGARIYYIYNEVFGAQLASINPTHNLSIHDIRTAIRNSTGPRPSLFVPELAFDLLVKPQISLLQSPSHRCVELVYEELMKIVHNVCLSDLALSKLMAGSIGAELNRFPKLQSKLIEVVSDLLRERLGPTIKYVESLIEIHRAYINTNHPNFVGAAKAMSLVVEERNRQKVVELGAKLRLASQRILNKKLRSKKKLATDIQEGVDEDKGIAVDDADGSDVDDGLVDSASLEDVNQVDDDIKPARHLRSDSNVTNMSIKSESVPNLSTAHPQGFDPHRSASAAGVNSHELYLNYFFGKDPITHKQHMQTQAQLNPTPFKFPQYQELTLQFNTEIAQSTSNSSNTLTPNGSYANGQPTLSNDFRQMQLADEHSMMEHIHAEDSLAELSEREQLECELIRKLIVSYFGIVREMIQDQVPKLIMCLLVNYIKQHIQNRLVVKLYSADLFDELLQEDAAIQIEREKCLESLKTYRMASRVISDVI